MMNRQLLASSGALMTALVVALILFLALPPQAVEGQNGSLEIREIPSPAPAGSIAPNLFSAPDGRVYLTWVEPTSTGQALRFAVREGANWSAARTIAAGVDWAVNWANFPSMLALRDGSLTAHWLVKAGDAGHACHVNVALSRNESKSWSAGVTPYDDRSQTEHGFVSLLPWNDGSAGVFWLDGRDKAGMDHAHQQQKGQNDKPHRTHSAAATALRFRTVDRSGRFSEEQVLDARVCDCCQTSAAPTNDGAIIAYRDRSPDETRDISVMRFVNGRWTSPQTVSADGWKIEGCPVNGPAVTTRDRQTAVAWFTAANDIPQVKVAFSSDGGASFGPAIRVDDGRPAGRVDVVILDDRSALVLWIESTPGGATVRAKRVKADGASDQSIILAQAGADRAASGFPRVERTKNELVFAWTAGKVKLAVARINN